MTDKTSKRILQSLSHHSKINELKNKMLSETDKIINKNRLTISVMDVNDINLV